MTDSGRMVCVWCVISARPVIWKSKIPFLFSRFWSDWARDRNDPARYGYLSCPDIRHRRQCDRLANRAVAGQNSMGGLTSEKIPYRHDAICHAVGKYGTPVKMAWSAGLKGLQTEKGLDFIGDFICNNEVSGTCEPASDAEQ